MATKTYSITIMDDDARLIITLVNASTGNTYDSMKWYAEDERHFVVQDKGEGPVQVQQPPDFTSREEAVANTVRTLVDLITSAL